VARKDQIAYKLRKSERVRREITKLLEAHLLSLLEKKAHCNQLKVTS
jgi:hypothetical protein